MSPEAMRIAIAEACGWKWGLPFNKRLNYNDLISPDAKGMCRRWRDGKLGGSGLPDYPEDLNACAEMEAILVPQFTVQQVSTWSWTIRKLSQEEGREGSDLYERIIRASAKTRCIAILTALNLYTP